MALLTKRADLPAESLVLDTLPSYRTLMLGFIIASLIQGQLLTHMLISRYLPLIGSGWICPECCFLGTAKFPTGVTLSFLFLSF